MLFRDALLEKYRAILDAHNHDNIEFTRASGLSICDHCGYAFADHPQHPKFSWLRVGCGVKLLKL